MSWVQGTYAIGAAIFAVVTCILFLCSRRKQLSSIGPVVAILLMCTLYVLNAYDYQLIHRTDGHAVRGAHYVFEGAALYFLFLSIVGSAHMNAAIALAWTLLHALAAVTDVHAVRVWAFVFGAVVWLYSLVIMCGSIITNTRDLKKETGSGWAPVVNFMFGLSMFGFLWYTVSSTLLHLAFVLGQNGFGIIGELGTAIWYLVADAILYVGLSFTIMYCMPIFALANCPDKENPPCRQERKDTELQYSSYVPQSTSSYYPQGGYQRVSTAVGPGGMALDPEDVVFANGLKY